MDSLQGRLLISSGGLLDSSFRHTVVLVGVHNSDGALGVVLNRALDVTVEETVPTLTDLVPAGEPLFQGGPVQPDSPVLLAELVRPELADIAVFGSVGFLVGEVSADLQPAFSGRVCLRATPGGRRANSRPRWMLTPGLPNPRLWATCLPMPPTRFGEGYWRGKGRSTGNCPGCRTTPR